MMVRGGASVTLIFGVSLKGGIGNSEMGNTEIGNSEKGNPEIGNIYTIIFDKINIHMYS